MNASAPGFFGKVTSHGDFVSRRLSAQMIEGWDEWLQQCIYTSRQQLGDDWLSHYLTAPVWRFAIDDGVLGQQAWCGVMMPSVDRVGRYFPLMIAAPAGGGPALLEAVNGGTAWFDELDDLARSSLAADFVLDQFDQLLLAKEAVTASAPPVRPAGWRLPMTAAPGELTASLAPLMLRGHSLWWTEGSPSVAPSLLLCSGMPRAEAFAAMLDGSWQQRGWAEAL